MTTAQKLIDQLLDEAYTPRSRPRKWSSMTPLDRLSRPQASLAREVFRNPSRYGLVKQGRDLVLAKTGELIYIDPDGWNDEQLAEYIKHGEFWVG